MAKPVLRRAVLEDVPDIQALTIRAYTKWLDVTPRPPRPITADYDQAFLDHRFDLLVDQGQIIGLVETTPQGDELMIVNIAVSPDSQGKGHGVRLMLHAEKIARDAGLRGTRLYTNKLMNSNIAMYQRLGYVIEKETHHDLGTIAVHMIHPFLPVGPVVENGHAALPAFQQHEGRCVTLAPLSASHSLQLWDAAQSGDASWTYLRYGPFGSEGDLKNHLQKIAGVADQPYFAVTPATSGMAEGWLSFCDISPENSSIEIGSIWYSPRLQRTRAATEAIYLLLDHAFSLGYHRVAWRCNPLNEASMRAAQRFGFTLEGIWREGRIVKGRRCDLAWFSMLEQEWPAQPAKFETWLEDSNFDASGMALRPMAATVKAQMMQRLFLTAVLVHDYDEAIAFYVNKLDFEVRLDTPLLESKRWVVLAPQGGGHGCILLAKAETDEQFNRIGSQTGGRVFLFLDTDNFDRDYRAYSDRGVNFVEEPRVEDYGTVAVFEDLFGNRWDLIQHNGEFGLGSPSGQY